MARKSITLVLFAYLFVSLVTGASSASAPGPQEEMDLYEHMIGLKKGLRTISTKLREGELEPCLEAVASMQEHTLAGKVMPPTNLDEIPPSKQADHSKAFRADMARLLSELALLEIELLEGKTEEASARIKEKLFELRESSHDRYQYSD